MFVTIKFGVVTKFNTFVTKFNNKIKNSYYDGQCG